MLARLVTGLKQRMQESAEAALRRREKEAFDGLGIMGSMLVSDAEKWLPQAPEQLRTASVDERKLWVAQQVANRYISDKAVLPEQIPEGPEVARNVFAQGFVELNRKDGSMRPVSISAGIPWERSITLFEQVFELARVGKLNEMRLEDGL